MDRKYNLRLDLQFRCNNSTMKFNQFDNNTSDFFMKISSGGKSFDVEKAIVVLAAIKPSGKVASQFVDVENGLVYADLKNSMKDEIGTYTAQAMLILEDERVVTDPINYEVEEDKIFSLLNDTVEYTEEYSLLTDMLNRLSIIEISEEQRQINEAERILSEENRKIEEVKRVEAELIRQHEEADRTKYDAIRESNENIRKQNESIRLSNETNRIDEEAKRVEEENKRKLAEEERKANYNFMIEDEERRRSEANAHKEAENLRVQAETNRVNEEAKRRTTEQARVSAENTRVSNENTREANEITRKSNETKRVEAETQRQNRYNSFITEAEANANNFENYTNNAKVKEEERKANELDRKSQEDRRVSNEVERISNENDRKANEVTRIESEKQRADAENLRKEKIIEIQSDYDSLKKVIIDENASANLQNQINKVSSQLEHKPNKTHIWNMANMGQDVKEAMTGGSVAVVGENTILTENIVDGQVTPSKTDFISLIAPTFEKNKCVSGHIIEDGTIASSGWTTTDFIPICKGHIYKIQGKTKFIALYDSSKNIIEGSYGTVTIPNRQFYSGYDGYVRFSFVTLEGHPDYQPLDTLQIYSIQGNYLTFNIPLIPNFLEKSIQDKDLATGCINARHFGVTNSIYRLKDLATMDGYIIYTNGNLIANSNYCYTEEPIPILEGSTYFIKHAVPNAGVYYDEDMNFLSLCDLPVSGAVDNVIFTTPVGAKYLRLNTQIINKETQYIALGTRELTQEEFDNVSLSSVSATWLKTDINDTIREEFKQEIFDEINLNQPSNYSSDWLGKTFVSLGDSITWQDSNAYGQGEQKGQIARGYQTIIKEKLGFISYLNKGMSGRPVSNGSANGDGTNTTSKTIDYSNFDLVIIAGGTNDFKLNMPLGELGIIGDTDFNTNTFYGAYRDMVEYILKQKPTIRIVLFTPLQRDNGGYDVNYVNSVGCKLIDYVNAIKDVGKMYGIPICDMYSNSGFTKLTLNTYTMDGLHPNDVGYSRMGNYASKFIDNIGI